MYYQDSDGDGFGNAAIDIEETTAPSGYVENNLDCDDSNKEINPDATEVFNNTIDENCDGEMAEKELFGGDVKLLTQQDVDDFGRHNYKTIYGKLQIGTENEPNTSIVSLEPLRALRVVRQENSVYIYSNHALKNLEGLNNLSSIDHGLYIDDNILLENLAELSSLITVGTPPPGEYLSITNNASLTALEGLQNLATVNNIIISDNPKLYDFCSFEEVKDPDFPSRYDIYHPDLINRSFTTSGNRYNPDVIAMREGLCADDTDRLYDGNILESSEYQRYAFLRKSDELTSIEGILTDFGTSQTDGVQAYTYQIGQTADWYIIKIPQDYNESESFYELLRESGFYDPITEFGMFSDDNYSTEVIGLGSNIDQEAYAIYMDHELRIELKYPRISRDYGYFGTWFGSFQNDEVFVLTSQGLKGVAYPGIKKFSTLLEELGIVLNTLDTIEFRDFEIFRKD
ncbi:putative metal-binding motif-containing protein [Pricia sp.]|uniref:putative metal-binding motif-containing protein n=1 Tax=Pricia sp. TaxID=2268138 RepID=UPI00359302EF